MKTILAVFLFFGGTACAETLRSITLAEAIETALGSHPALKGAAARIQGSEGLRRQAGLRPNPSVSLQTENWRINGVPGFRPAQELDIYGFASQTLETGGKRARRVEVAQLDLRIAELEHKALQWKIRQDVRQAYLRALVAQRQLEITQESGRFFDQVVEYHRVRVEQGVTAEADLIKVRLERQRMALSENTAAVEAERARIDLLRAAGASSYDSAFQLVEEPPQAPNGAPLDQDTLLELARENRSDVLAAKTEVDRARAELEAQKSLAKPDWTVLFGYKRTSGYDTLLAGVSVPLPFFNRNEGNIFRGQTEISRAEYQLSSALSQVAAEIKSALISIRRNRSILQQMEKTMLQQADESRRISFSAYQEGGADLLRLLDAQRVRNEVQMLFTRTQMEYRLSLADLENAVGQENLALSEELLRVQP